MKLDVEFLACPSISTKGRCCIPVVLKGFWYLVDNEKIRCAQNLCQLLDTKAIARGIHMTRLTTSRDKVELRVDTLTEYSRAIVCTPEVTEQTCSRFKVKFRHSYRHTKSFGAETLAPARTNPHCNPGQSPLPILDRVEAVHHNPAER